MSIAVLLRSSKETNDGRCDVGERKRYSSGARRVLGQRDGIVQTLRELCDVASEVGAKSLRDRVDRELVQKLEEDRFHLVVVGEFNHGKTTFVNALLGESVLPVGVTPTTASIHLIRWTYRPEACIVMANGDRRGVPIEDVRRFAVDGDSNTGDIDHIEIGYPLPFSRRASFWSIHRESTIFPFNARISRTTIFSSGRGSFLARRGANPKRKRAYFSQR